MSQKTLWICIAFILAAVAVTYWAYGGGPLLVALALLALVCPAVVIWVMRKQREVEAQLGARKAPSDAKQGGETARRRQP
jgi:cbb3-type cytochrome oxidase subunit 3